MLHAREPAFYFRFSLTKRPGRLFAFLSMLREGGLDIRFSIARELVILMEIERIGADQKETPENISQNAESITAGGTDERCTREAKTNKTRNARSRWNRVDKQKRKQ